MLMRDGMKDCERAVPHSQLSHSSSDGGLLIRVSDVLSSTREGLMNGSYLPILHSFINHGGVGVGNKTEPSAFARGLILHDYAVGNFAILTIKLSQIVIVGFMDQRPDKDLPLLLRFVTSHLGSKQGKGGESSKRKLRKWMFHYPSLFLNFLPR